MTAVSAVIITFNEEKNISRCLDSLSGIADEILVIDSYSKDKTAEICAEYGVKFIAHTFQDYASQKNYGNSLTSHDFILSLDADEALSEPLREAILKWKNTGSPDVMRVKRLTNYCGKWIKHCGWYPDAKYRLFDKKRARWAGERVHEYLEIDPDASKGELSGDLHHYSFYTIDQHLNTINKYSGLKAEIMFEKGKKPHIFKLIVNPAVRFLRDYFFKQGFRDGFYGFVISANSSYSVFLKYVKLWDMRIRAGKKF